MKGIKAIMIAGIALLIGFSTVPKAMAQIEVIDERTVRVQGRGWSDEGRRDTKLANARRMAFREAVELVVRDLLRDQTELSAFENIRSDFFSNVDHYVVDYNIVRNWEEGRRLNVEVSCVIRRDVISQELTAQGVLQSARETHRELDRFTIMPYVDFDNSSPEAYEFRETFYTRFRVFFEDLGIPTIGQEEAQMAEGDEEYLARMQSSTAETGQEDPALVLARNTPADIFVKITARIEHGQYGGAQTRKVVLTIGAYAVLTGEFIGSNDGMSEPYALSSPGASIAAGIDEAMNNAMPRVIDRMTAFWRDFARNGRPVKLIFLDFGFREKRALRDALQELTNEQRLIRDAGNLLEYMVWYDGSVDDLMYDLYDTAEMETMGLARDPQLISNTIRFQKQP